MDEFCAPILTEGCFNVVDRVEICRSTGTITTSTLLESNFKLLIVFSTNYIDCLIVLFDFQLPPMKNLFLENKFLEMKESIFNIYI